VIPRLSKKLNYQFLKLFQIQELVSKQSYQLMLLKAYSNIHLIFHMSLLELYHYQEGKKILILPLLIQQLDSEKYEVK
jgi:hypothetical protein